MGKNLKPFTGNVDVSIWVIDWLIWVLRRIGNIPAMKRRSIWVKIFSKNKQTKNKEKMPMGLNGRLSDNSNAAKVKQNEICIHMHKIWN